MDSASGSWHARNVAGMSYDTMQKYKPRPMVAKIEEYHPVCDRMIDINPEYIPHW